MILVEKERVIIFDSIGNLSNNLRSVTACRATHDSVAVDYYKLCQTTKATNER